MNGADVADGFAPVRAAAARMAGFGAAWGVGGGWAVDLFLGRVTREHADVDLAILRGDQQRLHAHLAGWELRKAVRGELVVWRPDERLDPPVHEIHARSPDGAALELLLNDHAADAWLFRRDHAVRCPLAEWIVTSAGGIPFLCPAIVLLYKAKAPRAADEADFDRLLPALPGPRRRWLRDALDRVHPGHPWRARL